MTLLFVARPLLTENQRKKRKVEHFMELNSTTLLWISSAVRFFSDFYFYEERCRLSSALRLTVTNWRSVVHNTFPSFRRKILLSNEHFYTIYFYKWLRDISLGNVSALVDTSRQQNIKDDRCRHRSLWTWWSSREIWRFYFKTNLAFCSWYERVLIAHDMSHSNIQISYVDISRLKYRIDFSCKISSRKSTYWGVNKRNASYLKQISHKRYFSFNKNLIHA